MKRHSSTSPFLLGFIIVSLLLHVGLFALSGRWLWQDPQYDVAIEPPPVVIQLEEFIEPPPPEPEPEPEVPAIIEEKIPEPEPEPEPPPPEPEPEPEPEIIPPEPVPVEPEPVPEIPAATVMAIVQPTYLRNPPPPYPIKARREGWEGTVLIRANISERGHVSDAAIAKSSGFEILDQAALNTVKRWRFAPARLAGRAVSDDVEVPIKFELRNK
jgi:periplasmic protein TonB